MRGGWPSAPGSSLSLAAICSALLVAVFGRTLFTALGGGGDAVTAAIAYALVFFPGCVAVWLCNSTLGLIRGAGNMAVPSLILLLVSLASIPLAGALALGWGPVPALGMAGLAAGPIAAFALGAVAALSYVATGRAGLPLAWSGLRWELFADILRVGVIASGNAVQTVLTIVIMVALVGRHGEAALAGYGLGARLEFLMIPIVFGIGAAMTAMVGANIGAGDRPRALRICWTGSFAAAVIVGAIGILLAVFPDLWLRLFLDAGEAGALEAGRAYFRTIAPFYVFFALGLALYFRQSGRRADDVAGGGQRRTDGGCHRRGAPARRDNRSWPRSVFSSASRPACSPMACSRHSPFTSPAGADPPKADFGL